MVPRVRISAILRDNANRVIMGNRKGGIIEPGKWQFPNTYLLHGEDFFECAERAFLESTALEVCATKVFSWTNDILEGGYCHDVTFFVLCERKDETQLPELQDVCQCEGWEWKSWGDVMEMGEKDLFLPVYNLLCSHPNVEGMF
ncbi:NUDIX hydrolase domain-like protein [Pseudomassariella vexata]|uniref:NUDIX hydrolase domain-like protein n=1 Tax=Pseudomassariella vexata TaxID=1141098 RepID=A0A1Y2DF96_9PEZI|nr:NUDIX hydrolase domain-like protein [Pseudomassariella vexata]ORY57774.1 NUDIX hydrolase domain-like protein [Pseudomassariella vexata]